MKSIVLCLAVFALTGAEPPVHNGGYGVPALGPNYRGYGGGSSFPPLDHYFNSAAYGVPSAGSNYPPQAAHYHGKVQPIYASNSLASAYQSPLGQQSLRYIQSQPSNRVAYSPGYSKNKFGDAYKIQLTRPDYLARSSSPSVSYGTPLNNYGAPYQAQRNSVYSSSPSNFYNQPSPFSHQNQHQHGFNNHNNNFDGEFFKHSSGDLNLDLTAPF